MFFLQLIGIGRCIDLKLSKLGSKVYAISRTVADLDNLNEEIINTCAKTFVYVMTVCFF